MLVLLVTHVLGACAPGSHPQDVSRTDHMRLSSTSMPAMKSFASQSTKPTRRANATIARDFLDLSFRLESGRDLPVFTRFEGPITLRVTGNAPSSLGRDLRFLLGRLHREAGIAITTVPPTAQAAITIEMVPRAQLQRLVPHAACFVAPRISSWAEYKKSRRSAKLDWKTLTEREQLAIFIPGDVAPQEIRDCLHEELAQALGPLNDLYRLSDSVFNDDNFHTVLTGFDMLILRTYYAPELHSGMTRSEVADRLPLVLARLNPAGGRVTPLPAETTPRQWVDAVETALSPRASKTRRKEAANTAVRIAQRRGWTDNRAAFSLFILARLTVADEIDTALSAFLEAGRLYRANPETSLQAAHVGMQLAAFSLSAGQAEAAIGIVNRHLPVITASQNAALLATMLMVKAEALETVGRASEARAVRLDSLGWARYGFGSDSEVRARLSEIAALAPKQTMLEAKAGTL
ncbi:DUF2927 domain-containing protein [Aliiroseovarius sp. PTFE2010]|uniref:DUF2927 domain-containing protein n=1 Tax=Aliiroseovarius sp. PTFE2010 TaxID=3417190 RepID=UPI003CF25B9C